MFYLCSIFCSLRRVSSESGHHLYWHQTLSMSWEERYTASSMAKGTHILIIVVSISWLTEKWHICYLQEALLSSVPHSQKTCRSHHQSLLNGKSDFKVHTGTLCCVPFSSLTSHHFTDAFNWHSWTYMCGGHWLHPHCADAERTRGRSRKTLWAESDQKVLGPWVDSAGHVVDASV